LDWSWSAVGPAFLSEADELIYVSLTLVSEISRTRVNSLQKAALCPVVSRLVPSTDVRVNSVLLNCYKCVTPSLAPCMEFYLPNDSIIYEINRSSCIARTAGLRMGGCDIIILFVCIFMELSNKKFIKRNK